MVYVPTRPPPFKSHEELALYLDDQLRLISQEFANLAQTYLLNPLAVEPTRPREGMLAYADGVNWNPGGGSGVYVYTLSGWSKL